MKRNLRKEIMERFKENGRVEIYSSIIDCYMKGTAYVPFNWGEDFFIKVLPNPGGNKNFVHFGRRIFKRVGGRWLVDNTFYKLENKEVNSIKELEFILNSGLFTEFANSVNWE